MRRTTLAFTFFALCGIPALATFATAEVDRTPVPAHKSMKLDQDGIIEDNEFIVIDTKGSTTRSTCPYTCEDRNLEKKHCRTWQSKIDPEKCYVKDTRIKSNAIQF